MEVVANHHEERKTTVDPPAPRAHEVLAGLFRFIAVTVILLAGVELISFFAVRVLQASVFEEIRGTRILAAYPGQTWAPVLAREEKAARQFAYEPYTVWRTRPFHGETVNFDADGMRRTYHSHCDAHEFTIWMFGGSTMRGNGSPDWGTIPSQLAELYEQAGQPACVRNYGEGAWVNTQEITQLMLALKREPRKPNLVIFYDGANEAFVPYQSGRADVHMNFDTIKSQFESQESARRGGFAYLLHTNTAQLLFSLVVHAAQHAGDRAVPTNDPDGLALAAVNNYFAGMDVVNALAHQYGFDYAFFWQPVVFAGHKPLTPAEEQIRDSKRQAHLAEWCPRVYHLAAQQQRPHFYDLTDAFDNTRELLFLDWCHIVISGNHLIAQRMFEAVRHNVS
jgi:hypothetical protein